jgi:hypothetical protein
MTAGNMKHKENDAHDNSHCDDNANALDGIAKLYLVFGIPQTAGEEGSPILVVVVQKKFDLMLRCQVIVPEY